MAKAEKVKEAVAEKAVEPAEKAPEAVASTVRPKLSDLVREAREGHEHRKAEALKNIKK